MAIIARLRLRILALRLRLAVAQFNKLRREMFD